MRDSDGAELGREIDTLRRRAHHRFGGGAIVTERRKHLRTDVSALRDRYGRELRILAPGNGATAADVGGFWFVLGYSEVGGPDVVAVA